MKIATPLHTDHQLDQLAGQFEHWRRTRSHPGGQLCFVSKVCSVCHQGLPPSSCGIVSI
jgi:hypothetical protein